MTDALERLERRDSIVDRHRGEKTTFLPHGDELAGGVEAAEGSAVGLGDDANVPTA